MFSINSSILSAIGGIAFFFRRPFRNVYDNRKPLMKKNVSTTNTRFLKTFFNKSSFNEMCALLPVHVIV